MKDALSILEKYKKEDEVFRLNIFLEYPELRDEFMDIEMESCKDKPEKYKLDQKPPRIVKRLEEKIRGLWPILW